MKKFRRVHNLLTGVIAMILIITLITPAAVASVSKLLPFTDVQKSDWYYDSVVFVCENSLFSGTSATAFSPNRTMTRGMIAAVLYRMASTPAVSGFVSFDDVDYGAYYEDAVIWADARGIINGTGEKTFSPESPATKEQFAVMLYRYAVLYCGINGEIDSVTPDPAQGNTDVNTYSKKAVSWCISKNLFHSKNTLDLSAPITRAEAADMLYQLSKLAGNGNAGYKRTLEKLISGYFNRSMYYDLDGDGSEELFISHQSQSGSTQLVSVYTIKSGTVAPLIKDETLFSLAGGPWGKVGAVKKDDTEYLCLLSESGETEPDSRLRWGTYKLYSLTDGTLNQEIIVKFQIQYVGSKVVPSASKATLNDGKKVTAMTYSQYSSWVDSLVWNASVFVSG